MGLRSSGENDKQQKRTGIKKHFKVHGPVFWPSVVLIMAMVVGTLLLGDQAETIFDSVQSFISNNTGWLFVSAVNVFLIFSIVIAFSRFGNIRLGGSDAKPEFSTAAWFAMLFSAGMGIGIMFWSVAEPIYHFLSPPMASGETVEAAQQAMSLTYLQWNFILGQLTLSR